MGFFIEAGHYRYWLKIRCHFSDGPPPKKKSLGGNAVHEVTRVGASLFTLF